MKGGQRMVAAISVELFAVFPVYRARRCRRRTGRPAPLFLGLFQFLECSYDANREL